MNRNLDVDKKKNPWGTSFLCRTPYSAVKIELIYVLVH